MANAKEKCIHWWKLNDVNSLVDEIGGVTLTKQGSPTNVSSKFGNGVYSNTGADYIEKTSFTIDFNKVVMSMVLKTDYNVTNGASGDGNVHNIVFFFNNSTNYIQFNINSGDTNTQFRVGGTTYNFRATTGLTWTAGDEVDLLYVFDRTGIDGGSDTFRLYLGDTLVYSSTQAVNNQSLTTCSAWWLANVDAGNQELDGSIDNHKMFNDSSQETIDGIRYGKDKEGFGFNYAGVI